MSKPYAPFPARCLINGIWLDTPVTAEVLPQEAVRSMAIFISANDTVYITHDQAKNFFGLCNNIWGTSEADAWSRGFMYLDYVRLCEARQTKPVASAVYTLLYQAFNMQMELDNSMRPSNG